MYQGIVKATASGELEARADSGQLQFWSEPSEILNVNFKSTTETVAFSIP